MWMQQQNVNKSFKPLVVCRGLHYFFKDLKCTFEYIADVFELFLIAVQTSSALRLKMVSYYLIYNINGQLLANSCKYSVNKRDCSSFILFDFNVETSAMQFHSNINGPFV